MSSSSPFGTNIAFIEELFDKYRHNPESVSPSWREFFQDYEPQPETDEDGDEPDSDRSAVEATLAQWSPQPAGEQEAAAGEGSAHRAPAETSGREPQPGREQTEARGAKPASAPPAARGAEPDAERTIVPLRGIASKIAQNMEASLEVPTATSMRTIPVKILEENRQVVNHHLTLNGQNKASFTHVIGWAIVKAVREFPRMNSEYALIDGQPSRIDHVHVNLGLAIDVEKKDGSRTLLVPNVRKADTLDFSQFVRAYNEVVRKARSGSLEIGDFEGTTITLTNPGTIGTVASIPRLMPKQGTIIATGQIDYPAEYSATDTEVLAELGVSKVMTISSTYDHRIIQGAESGSFLAKMHELLLGAENFYDEIFRDLRIPYEPHRWARDRQPSLFGGFQSDEVLRREASVLQIINAYRVRGHLIADLDPLDYRVGTHPELNLSYYGLTVWDLDREFITGGLSGKTTARLREILDVLRDTYCGKLAPEYMHIQSPTEKKWLQERMEPGRNNAPLDPELKRRILAKLTDAEAFEKFLHTKYIGHKRFSLEGAESLIPMIDHLLNLAARDSVRSFVIGMAHRGRLNVLANILGKSYEKIFTEFEGDLDPESAQGSGDVKYHLGSLGVHEASGRTVELRLASNPSHLEAVDPIVEGMARAGQKLLDDRERSAVIPLLIHGDAAFAGQGVVAETLNLSQLPGYTTGGTVHVVVNNQIGFTTGPEEARSSVYATDVAKMVQAPIFHVNGDDPEACVRAMAIAYEFRQKFKKDVVIDMVCYRRHGHNEGDDPSFTQPRMYKLIRDHRSTRKLYTEALLRKGDIDPKEAEEWLETFQARLQEAFERTRDAAEPPPAEQARDPLWTDEDTTGIQADPSPETAIPQATVDLIETALTTVPEGFTIHPKLRSLLERRRAMLDAEAPMDWAIAELVAFGAVMLDGHRVRLSGQDSGRGTFSQRHAVLVDNVNGRELIPLNRLREVASLDEARAPHQRLTEDARIGFSVYDSLLSEYGVLGFEYGYSVGDPATLVLWEAQFGDFMNGAQIIIDQFVSSAEEKWFQHSGLVMLLPHGYEGQGPEHSSARLERFLILCAEGNLQVVYPTTPAQYFHVLRRQMRNDPRKPLVVMTPKSLLRHPRAGSPVEDLMRGRFEPVLDDPLHAEDAAGRDSVRRLILTSGKLYYDLAAAREQAGLREVAIVRLEQFYPWPRPMLLEVFGRYPALERIIWAQEEPRNMGGWDFVDEKLVPLVEVPIRYVGRPFSASPATGSHLRHEAQQKAIVEAALGESKEEGNQSDVHTESRTASR
ncbi:MAG TPA: multifunctional oxoglutarate decarboxylase/oxoglutarate dehydrogenase thiamine pyrophosphate-binding subunit/dihydrolipoyllysine-residue succinyltransferase subunit [Thermoanaerobaculia bacterium]|nr:multifunctional oxoglutarate decarboxylase/oxoglutarate dehydrogenase thiamine pyrophosphate-binding subunit/dihydrolipoyllysine-residue succinyltransferase subunit [Thermoanaerobaculia bacterium]